MDTWINECPQKLLTHLPKLCNLDDSSRSNFLLAKMIQQIYKLIQQFLSCSSPRISWKSCTKPCRSHTFLLTWFNKATESEIKFPNSIVRVVFDNEQVIGKCYWAKADQASVPGNVITSSVYLIIDCSNNMQLEDIYKPSDWMFKSVDESLIDWIIDSFESNNGISEWLVTNFKKRG